MSYSGEVGTQTIAEIKERVRLSEWESQIASRQAEGVGVEEWCKRTGISKSTYYYRLRKVREEICRLRSKLPAWEEEAQIVPVREVIESSAESKIEISSGNMHVTFSGKAEVEALKTVLEVLGRC